MPYLHCNKSTSYMNMSPGDICTSAPPLWGLKDISMFGGAYGDACMLNWPHWHRTPLPGNAATGLCRDKGGNALGQATFLSHFSSATQVCGRCDYTLPSFWDLRISDLVGKLAAGCLRSRPAWIVFCFRCWVADGKNGGGMAMSGIGFWVAVAMGHSRAISILRRIVRATKAATWSHPSVPFSIIGTKPERHMWQLFQIFSIVFHFPLVAVKS